MENTMQPSLPLQHQQHPEHLRQRQRCRQRCVLFTLPSRSGAVPACCTPALSVPMQINLVFCSHCLGKSREGELTSFKRDLKNKLSAQLGTEESQAELCLAKTAPIPSYTLQPTQKQLHNKPCSQPDHHLAVSGMFRGCHHAAHTHTHTLTAPALFLKVFPEIWRTRGREYGADRFQSRAPGQKHSLGLFSIAVTHSNQFPTSETLLSPRLKAPL